MSDESPISNRREFLSGLGLGKEVSHVAAQAGDALLGELAPQAVSFGSGPTVRLSTRAMNSDFQVVVNAGPDSTVEAWNASDALNVVHELESQLTVYRDDSDVLRINRLAAEIPVEVEPRLFELLKLTVRLAQLTERAYDPTTLALVKLWRRCRSEMRIPSEDEVQAALALTGIEHVKLDDSTRTVRLDGAGVELQLNAIGKGYALDRAAEVLQTHAIPNWLLHGGQSSVLAQGMHHDLPGWPIGIMNPLFPQERLGTVLLRNEAMGTSGNSVQFFRYRGHRYGHLLDPRTGWPAESLLSATVIAPSSAEADALSTAFFVMGLEKARAICQNRPDLRAILIPPPRAGRTLEPVLIGIPPQDFRWAETTAIS